MRLKDILESPSFRWAKKFKGVGGAGKGTSCTGVFWTGLTHTVRGRWISPAERKQRKAVMGEVVSEVVTDVAEDTGAA